MKKIKRTIKKLWQWLTVQRYVDISFGTEMSDKELAKDFAQAKENIQIINFRKIMTKLIKFQRDLELSQTGLLLTDDQAKERAYQSFCLAKKDGKLDELNRICCSEQINA